MAQSLGCFEKECTALFRRARLALPLVLFGLIPACHAAPTLPAAFNHLPVLTSLTVTPTNIGISDSALVTCIASDQDGDALVYDWETDIRLRIKGRPSGYPIKFNTLNNAETFYPDYLPTTTDTVWVFCTVRDRLGGASNALVLFTVHP